MESYDHCETDAAATLEAGQQLQKALQTVQRLHTPSALDADGVPFILNSQSTPVSLEAMLLKPVRHRATPTLTDVQSFIEYVKLFSTENTLIFANIGTLGGTFHAALDMAAKDETSWNEHNATFKLVPTPDWTTWINANKKWLKQEEFVQFVETQRHVFSNPSSATMLEIAMSLEASINGNYKSAFRNSNGSRTLIIDMSTDASFGQGESKTTVPQEITVILAPFEGQEAVQVSAFLRFRPGSDGVVFQYELQRPEEATRKSAEEARAKIASDTGLTVLNGQYAPR